MRFDILTIFPEIFESYFKESIIKRAIESQKIEIIVHDIRKFTEDKHQKVDAPPYGGGPGMVMMPQPICDAIEYVKTLNSGPVLYMSPRGKVLAQSKVLKLAKIGQENPNNQAPGSSEAGGPEWSSPEGMRSGGQFQKNNFPQRNKKTSYFTGIEPAPIPNSKQSQNSKSQTLNRREATPSFVIRNSSFVIPKGLILLCGRYEGIDQRAIDLLVDEEISIGKYVLTGGELAAMVIIDAVSRFVPGVLGDEMSHEEESFSKALKGKKEYPHYTRPEVFRGMKVPDVLLSGHHAKIKKWREENVG